MFYDEEKATIVAYQAEIDENPEYEHIEKIIEQNPNIWAKLNKGNNIIIFDVLKTYEDGPHRCDEDDNVYVEILALCTMQIMYDYEASTTSFSEKSYPEQMKEIITVYREEYGYTIPDSDLEKIDITDVLLHGTPTNYAIVPVIVENWIGKKDEYEYLEFEDDEEEEEEDDPSLGRGQLISRDGRTAEEQKADFQTAVDAAIVDGIEVEYIDDNGDCAAVFHNVTKKQIQKYNDIYCEACFKKTDV